MNIYDRYGRPLRRWGDPDPRASFAQPSLADLRPVDPVTTGLSIASRNTDYAWDKLAPVMEVAEKSGTIPIYTASYWFRRQEGAERAAEGPYNRVGYGTSTTTYDCVEIGFEKPIGDVVRAGSQFPDDQEEVAAQFLANLIQLELEKRVAAAMFVTGVWGTSTTLTLTDQWSDFDASDPIAKADTAKTTIRRATGAEPNLMFVGALAWEKLKEHPLVLDKYKYTQKGIMTEDMVAAVLGVDELVVGKSVEETGAEGASSSTADIWTDNALFLVANKPGLMVSAGGFTVMWNERGNIPWAVESYRDDTIRSNITRAFTHVDPQIVSSSHGYIYLDCVA